MKKILFSLVVAFGLSSAYGMNIPQSPCAELNQDEVSSRENFRFAVISPRITRAERMCTPEGRDALWYQIQRGSAIANMTLHDLGEGVHNVSRIMSREDLADLYAYYNTTYSPEYQMREIITNTAPDLLMKVLIGRIIYDSEADFVSKLTQAALHQLSDQQATELMQMLQSLRRIVRLYPN